MNILMRSTSATDNISNCFSRGYIQSHASDFIHFRARSFGIAPLYFSRKSVRSTGPGGGVKSLSIRHRKCSLWSGNGIFFVHAD